MTAEKYSKVITIILIILVIAIVAGAGVLGMNFLKKQKQDARMKKEKEEFDRVAEENQGIIEEDDAVTEEEETEDQGFSVEETERPEQVPGQQIKKPRNEDGYIISGYISISKTNISLPILDTYSAESIESGVAVLWPTNPKLNEPGNTVIVGHNRKDGRFFSNNKKLSIGDKIKIKDIKGRELTYTIYDKFETTPEDASFYARDTNGAIEITLSTCTDDVKARTIILARVEQ